LTQQNIVQTLPLWHQLYYLQFFAMDTTQESTLTLADFLHEQQLVELEAARAFPGEYTECTWPDTANQKLYTCMYAYF
jgi:hypothetical protein